MSRPRVLIFVVCFHAERFIASVLERIPAAVWSNDAYDVEILVIDDGSADATFERARAFLAASGRRGLTVLRNPVNQGYGGNQKIGYHYAIEKGFTAVVLLHGDGQYAPERLPDLIAPILSGEADVVLGSRMLRRADALKGGMPLYKWVGNQILTALQNRLLGTRLAEFHTGYRAYRVASLSRVPFQANADYFDFDTDILIQLTDTGARIREVAIPTYYGEEISRVNGMRYAALIVWATLLSRVVRWGILYQPKFDYGGVNEHYRPKLGYPSSHEFALARVRSGATVMDLGCGPGYFTRELVKRGAAAISVDWRISDEVRALSRAAIEGDLDDLPLEAPPLESAGPGAAGARIPVDAILALDVIEHLRSPEAFLRKIREAHSARPPEVVITTGNVAFILVRLALLLGQFNYGKRGILDLTHTRLFTFGSLRRALVQGGYDVLLEQGIPAPFPEALGPGRIARLLLLVNRALIFLSKGLFSYQIAFVARPRPTLAVLLRRAEEEAVTRASGGDDAGGSRAATS